MNRGDLAVSHVAIKVGDGPSVSDSHGCLFVKDGQLSTRILPATRMAHIRGEAFGPRVTLILVKGL